MVYLINDKHVFHVLVFIYLLCKSAVLFVLASVHPWKSLLPYDSLLVSVIHPNTNHMFYFWITFLPSCWFSFCFLLTHSQTTFSRQWMRSSCFLCVMWLHIHSCMFIKTEEITYMMSFQCYQGYFGLFTRKSFCFGWIFQCKKKTKGLWEVQDPLSVSSFSVFCNLTSLVPHGSAILNWWSTPCRGNGIRFYVGG